MPTPEQIARVSLVLGTAAGIITLIVGSSAIIETASGYPNEITALKTTLATIIGFSSGIFYGTALGIHIMSRVIR